MRKSVGKRLLSLVLALALCVTVGLVSSGAASALTASLQGYKAMFEWEYTTLVDDGYYVSTPDVWSLYPLVRAGLTEDANYAFMVPAANDNALKSDSVLVMAKELLTAKLQNRSADAVKEALVAKQANGAFGETSVETIWAVVALELADATYDRAGAEAVLIAHQQSDGGYNDYGNGGEVDLTAMAMIALKLLGSDAPLEKAVSFMENALQEDGNLVGNGEWSAPNSCSQAYGIMGLLAAGEDVTSDEWNSAVTALYSYIDESGCFWYDEASQNGDPYGYYDAPDSYSSIQGMMALADLQAGNNLWVWLAQQDEIPATTQATTEPTTELTTNGAAIMVSTTGAAEDPNPETGDAGVPPILWVMVGGALVVILAAVIVPVLTKKKKQENQPSDSEKHDSE